ncbi:hypothetical protein LCGC14_0404000 [marine sediment metagenome]|uniref:Ig-like domain-containing protein n=1 Tax=marine sediment metagenome TaxID=412755 RepID=A0A0F9VHU8_9ZZZZ
MNTTHTRKMPKHLAKKKKSRVSPSITTLPKFVDYESLTNGDTFLYNGGLWMRCELYDQEAINIDNGNIESCMCEAMVEPVDISITWKKK